MQVATDLDSDPLKTCSCAILEENEEYIVQMGELVEMLLKLCICALFTSKYKYSFCTNEIKNNNMFHLINNFCTKKKIHKRLKTLTSV